MFLSSSSSSQPEEEDDISHAARSFLMTKKPMQCVAESSYLAFPMPSFCASVCVCVCVFCINMCVVYVHVFGCVRIQNVCVVLLCINMCVFI